jgi:hypothetical protein
MPTTINSSGQTITQYTVQVGGANNVLASIGPGSSGQVLQSGGVSSNPAYSTATYPSTASTSGFVITSDGTNFISSLPAAQYIKTTITSAQIKALRANPITLISAQGANTVIEVISIVGKYVYAGTNAFTNGQVLGLFYNSASGAPVSDTANFFNTVTMNGTASIYSTSSVGVLTNQAVGVYDNSPIVFCNTGGSEITGNAANDNTIIISLVYRVHTMT